MATNYVISDGYFKGEYPMKASLDINRFYAVQKLEQKTTLKDFLGENLYNYLIDTVLTTAIGDRTEIQTEFLSQVQSLMVFYVARGIEDFAENSNENRVSSIKSKIGFTEKVVRTYINGVDELVTIKDTDAQLDRVNYQGLPTYFFR